MGGSGAKRSPVEREVSEAEIRALIESRVEAVRAKDVDGAMSDHAPDAVVFDVINPLRFIGSGAAKKRAGEWFSSFEGRLGFEIQDLRIVAGDDVAFSYGLNHVNGSRPGGTELDMWWRATVCYQKVGGKWTIVHEHNSAPFDVASGKASLDLKP
jgi:ketosteroid isomerase-like protein